MRIPLVSLFDSRFPNQWLNSLKRNLELLSVRYGPYATTKGYTFTDDDEIDSLQVDATAGAITVYLPAQPNGNRRRRVIKTDASANAVTVNGNGNLINGSATYSLAARYNYVDVEPDGANWLIVGS